MTRVPRARAALFTATVLLPLAMVPAGCHVRRRRHGRGAHAMSASAGPLFRMPAHAAPGGPATVAAGYQHTCGLSGSGDVFCWGAGGFLQLGAPDAPLGHESTGMVRVRGVRDATGLAAGEYQTCALGRGGAVWCWGDNRDGQLGASTPERSSEPLRVGVITDGVQISAGPYATCVVRRNGAVVCWGRDSLCGRAVVAGGEDVSPPVALPGITDASRVAVGRFHACALSRGGSVLCWGSNEYGVLGSPDSAVFDRLAPMPVAGITDAVDLATRADHTCIVRRNGAVACWGDNEAGQLGRGAARSLAARPRDPVPVVEIGDGGDVDSGVPAELLESPAVMDVPGITDAVRVVTGQWHTCALHADGRVSCWGNNELGQLGVHAPRTGSVQPMDVLGLTDAVDLAAGQRHTCARRRTGEVVCWGDNTNGQLGTRATRWSSRFVTAGAAVTGELVQEPEE